MFVTNTNFPETAVRDLVHAAAPHIAQVRRRGPQPRSSWGDAFLCYMSWARFGLDYDIAAQACSIKAGRFEDNCARVRPVLLALLRSRWWAPRRRPTPLADSTWPHVALLVDSNTTQVYRPRAPFQESKRYWDSHNHVYGIKKEVAVMATPPYYCMFSHKGFIGSTHDYEEHERVAPSYQEYLLKTPEEHRALPGDAQQRFWAIMADSAYIGPEAHHAVACQPGSPRCAHQRRGGAPPQPSRVVLWPFVALMGTFASRISLGPRPL